MCLDFSCFEYEAFYCLFYFKRDRYSFHRCCIQVNGSSNGCLGFGGVDISWAWYIIGSQALAWGQMQLGSCSGGVDLVHFGFFLALWIFQLGDGCVVGSRRRCGFVICVWVVWIRGMDMFF